jgi:hypothetical protein
MRDQHDLVALALGALLAGAGAAKAETIAEKEYWAGQMFYTQRSLDLIREHCGAVPRFEFDKASWWANRDTVEAKGASPYGRCDDVLGAIWGICMGGPAFAEAVRNGIQSVTCGYGGVDSGYRIELNEGALRYDVELDKANAGDAVTAYLKSKL